MKSDYLITWQAYIVCTPCDASERITLAETSISRWNFVISFKSPFRHSRLVSDRNHLCYTVLYRRFRALRQYRSWQTSVNRQTRAWRVGIFNMGSIDICSLLGTPSSGF